MLRPLFLSSLRRVPRLVLLASLVFAGAVSATSCLTPDATFSQGDGDANLGGQSGDGDVATEHCANRRIDADETDIDCGGRDCDPCALGRMCDAGSDCVNGTCTAGRCQMPSCTDGVKNSSETDEDCGGNGCPPCADGKRCEMNSDCESASCKGGFCAEPACDDRIRNGNESDLDCGGSCDPCETGSTCVLNSDCLQPPTDDPATATCDDGICTLICEVRTADCNSRASDGCETDTGNDLLNCGGCGEICDPAHTVGGICNNGSCEIDFEAGGCTGAWRDCNGEPEDGCEINTNTNASHCSDCYAACSTANGTASCTSGACSVVCNDGYENCDENARETGCEVRTETNTFMCGSCDTNCQDQASTTQSAYCVDGSCGFTTCDPGKGDCNGNGSCDNDLNTTQNCGACGNACNVANATTTCQDQGGGAFNCAIAGCVDSAGNNWENCDSSYSNGCETNINTNVLHCGGCVGSGGQSCAALMNNAANNIASIICDAGACKITGCSSGYADCDNNPNNGCEANLTNTATTCGSCGTNCTSSIGTNNVTGVDCASSACRVTTCASNRADCDGTFSNGCEINTSNSTTHCGGCQSGPTTTWDGGANCSSSVGTNSITAVTCSTGNCAVSTCAAGRADCDGTFSNGCEINTTNNATHCGGCTSGPTTTWDGGVACANKTNANRACTTSSCVWTCQSGWKDSNGDLQNTVSNGCETAVIGVINSNTTATGSMSGDLSFTHNLQTSSATNNKRAVILILGNNSNDVGLPPPVTYDGATMTLAGSKTYFNQSSVHILYILNAALPTSAKTATILVDGNSNNTMRWTAHVLEVTNIDQSSPIGHFLSQGAGGSACNANLTVNTNTDALVVSGLVTQGDDTFGALSGQNVLEELFFVSTNTIAGYFTEVPSGTRQVRWSCSDFEWAHAVVAFNPEGTD